LAILQLPKLTDKKKLVRAVSNGFELLAIN